MTMPVVVASIPITTFFDDGGSAPQDFSLGSVTSGHGAVLFIGSFGDDGFPYPTITDSQSNSWVLVGGDQYGSISGNHGFYAYVCRSFATSGTLTLTLANYAFNGWFGGVIVSGQRTGSDMVDVWEVVAPDSGQLGSPGSRLASMTTSSSVIDSDELAVAAFFVGRANKVSTNIAVSGGGYTQQSISQDSDGFPGGYVGTRTASPSGTVTAAWTFDQYDASTPAYSDVFTAIVTVRAVTSGGGGTITLSGGGEIQLDHILSPSGYTASGSVGSLFNASNASVEITGNGGATALGTVNTAVVYAVSGFSATSALGTVVSPGANDVTHAVDGFQGTLSLGGLDQSIGSEISLLGFGLTGSIGEVISGDAGPSGVTNGNDNGLNVVRVSVTGWVDIVYRADPSVADPTEPGYQFSNGRSFNSPT